MKIFGNQKIEQKATRNAQFFDLSNFFLLYEAEKKISFLEKDMKKNNEAAEKALNNKEALKERTPMRIYIKTVSNNSKELNRLKVNCYKHQQKNKNVDRQKNNTKAIFFVI